MPALARFLCLAVPAIGLAELGAHFYFARSAPTENDWAAAAPVVKEMAKPGDLVVVAPRWAEPNARAAFDAELMPLRDIARPDESAYARAIEVGLGGRTAPELEGWAVVDERRHGPFELRVRENPKPARVVYDFTDSLHPAKAQAIEQVAGRKKPCGWNAAARVTAGGLGGHPTFPAQRFACGGSEFFFAGVTVIDDHRYRARRCIWAHPPTGGTLTVRFRDVELGAVIRGYGALPWIIERDEPGTPIELDVRVGGSSIGKFVHADGEGWKKFEFATNAAGQKRDVEFEVSSRVQTHRHFCFHADTR